MLTLALAGNPNCGKTALFNRLTGVRQSTGNWPGVTVDRKEGRFDLLGREVARLVDRQMPQGRHEVTWDGERVPSGVYLYRLEAGGETHAGKVVLAR